MTSFLLNLLFNIIALFHEEPHLHVKLNTHCAHNIISVARARRRRRMRLSGAHSVGTTIHIVGLLWLSWATQQVRSWAWGPYNDDWRKHHEPPTAGSANAVYRVVLPRNGTIGPTWSGNSSGGGGTATGTGTIPLSTWSPSTWSNATANASTTTTMDTNCGVTSPLYTLQVSGADGFAFDEWWLKLSGNSILFTPQKEKATSFGVNSDTWHLCIPRSSSTQSRAGKLPLVAIVETRLDQGPLYFLDANRTAGHQPEYEPIVCDSLEDGNGLSCSWDGVNIWSGCGMQLELGSGLEGTVGNLNCSNISLNAFRI